MFWKTERGGQASLGYGNGVNCSVLAELDGLVRQLPWNQVILTIKGVGILLVDERVDNLFADGTCVLALFRDDAILTNELLLQRDNFSLSLVLFRNDPD